eukprot:2147198-Pleurochrysis_carterae.AAC.1
MQHALAITTCAHVMDVHVLMCVSVRVTLSQLYKRRVPGTALHSPAIAAVCGAAIFAAPPLSRPSTCNVSIYCGIADTVYFDTTDEKKLPNYVDPAFRKNYQCEVGALIYAPPCGRPGETFAIGILTRALTFPAKVMDDYANRVLAYMVQNADEGIENKTQGGAQLVAYSDSDWAVAHSTIGFCIMYSGAAVSYGSKRQHCISLASTEAEIVPAGISHRC